MAIRIDFLSNSTRIKRFVLEIGMKRDFIAEHGNLCQFEVKTKYSRTSMARTSLGPWEFVRNMDSSSR